ncbi:hypothetical protein HY17_04780 [Hyphomonas sp. CY54-11-8]|jgi:hypothetical protein|nr:hypothetical protein HY17_04780 [Hyphomonas sp. CY54-11-8]RAN39612.1 hypothetical protein HY26_02530 [Hyphomonas sp. GM-8P]
MRQSEPDAYERRTGFLPRAAECSNLPDNLS